ncbi:hypothetical protein AAC03nite_01110 [Alicyclobacillus acidoterrestris]|uniref:hypothetical protein n=1 Tax=Alicyclobacillus suci TaxID=2816080 RepID=UPI00119090D2|nr:hypothetical protein [Alicyclobacillus suci]GEO24326.1 hypothetical protein AAC03nite_01110 [Alicyclobacillus acidoterrestris]
MPFQPTFAAELNQLAGTQVEVAFDNTITEGVIAFANSGVLGLVQMTGGYAPTNQVTFIATTAIDFVRLLNV